MNGLDILIRSMSIASPGTPGGKRFQYGNLWQYHPRSDRHSKIACWSIIFDLLNESTLLLNHVAARKVAIGINRPMRDFARNRAKNLDLVICRLSTSDTTLSQDFADLTQKYVIILSQEERTVLEYLLSHRLISKPRRWRPPSVLQPRERSEKPGPLCGKV